MAVEHARFDQSSEPETTSRGLIVLRSPGRVSLGCRGRQAGRVAGASLGDVAGVLAGEIAVGVAYGFAGYLLFRFFEGCPPGQAPGPLLNNLSKLDAAA